MFWDREKVLAVYQTPVAVEGDPYIRRGTESDKKALGCDRERGEVITKWEEKLRYPYKTKVSSTLTVLTNKRELTFKLKLDSDTECGESFIWNGQNIPVLFWSILGISKHSPEGLTASMWHDYLLFKKEDCLEQMRVKYPETTVGEYRRLTTLIFRQLLKNYGVNTIKANIMGGAVGGWQFVSPQWWGID